MSRKPCLVKAAILMAEPSERTAAMAKWAIFIAHLSLVRSHRHELALKRASCGGSWSGLSGSKWREGRAMPRPVDGATQIWPG